MLNYNLEIKTFNKLAVNLRGKSSGSIKTECPHCQKDRTKNKHDKPLSVIIESGVYKCHHCGEKGNIHEFCKIKDYSKPELPIALSFEQKTQNYFANRGITKETIDKMKVIVTDFNNEKCIAFQYFENSELINVKYRDKSKKFYLSKNCELIPYNIDCLKLKEKYLIICEGEFDCLSWIERDYFSVISVPNGASENTSYLDKYIDEICNYEKIILATDNDAKGILLNKALITRIGEEKCFNLDYKGCKDTNEYLQKNKELKTLFDSNFNTQIKGLVDLTDIEIKLDSLFETGYILGKTIGIPQLDNLIKWELGKFAVITGLPSSGKSEFVDFICMRLNLIHKWKIGYFSPESPTEIHAIKLIDKIIGKSTFNKEIGREQFACVKDFIKDNYFWILPESEDFTIKSILKLAEKLIRTKGIKVLILDPYNCFEHDYSEDKSVTSYVSRFLARVTNFARKHNILIVLVAHPKKIENKNKQGDYKPPGLYDISDSAHFYNKCDYGIIQHIDFERDIASTRIEKVKTKWMGKKGVVEWIYNMDSGRYDIFGTEQDNTTLFDI